MSGERWLVTWSRKSLQPKSIFVNYFHIINFVFFNAELNMHLLVKIFLLATIIDEARIISELCDKRNIKVTSIFCMCIIL